MIGHLDDDQICGLAEDGVVEHGLDAAARALAEAHLRDCADCRQALGIARGYFREIADLETVKAPANFLANVRARLPQPSPWRARLERFMRPMRVIPMQVALLTILGLTAISSYLYQRGGLQETQQVHATSPSASASDPVLIPPRSESAPVARAPVAKTVAKTVVKAMAKEDRDDATSDSRRIPNATKGGGYAQAPSPKKTLRAEKPTVQRARSANALSDEALAEDESTDALTGSADHPEALAIAPETPSAPSAASERLSASAAEWREDAVASREKKAEASVGKAKDADAHANAKSGSVSKAYTAESDAEESRPAARGSSEKQSSPRQMSTSADDKAVQVLPGFTLRPATVKGVSEILSGLKAMGAVALSAPTGEKSADAGQDRYVFRVPRSMLPEIGPYLERYGKVERAGSPGAAPGSAPVLIFLRIQPIAR